MSVQRKIAVIGLGYVGLPVAVAFGEQSPVIGFDLNPARIQALSEGRDETLEVTSEQLASSDIQFTHDSEQLKQANFYIVAVPTPIDANKRPDLSYLHSASAIIGKQLNKGDIVVFESTVYPGATEEECIPVLEQNASLKAGLDFMVGYSPERINPGDKTHGFKQITKVVAGQDADTLEIIAETYGSVVTAGIHKAPSIKVAEAAKVIENTQRDLNIALMNELSVIFERMDIDTLAVIEAAKTKWNFQAFKPGLVGGHCIGVDPYYLTHKAQQLGYTPDVILAGRGINDAMGKYIVEQTVKRLIQAGRVVKAAPVAVLGLTFKENCPDLRNSKVADVIAELQNYGIEPYINDPIANEEETQSKYNFNLTRWADLPCLEAIILCVSHKEYQALQRQDYLDKLTGAKLLVDVKGALNPAEFANTDITLWRL